MTTADGNPTRASFLALGRTDSKDSFLKGEGKQPGEGGLMFCDIGRGWVGAPLMDGAPWVN